MNETFEKYLEFKKYIDSKSIPYTNYSWNKNCKWINDLENSVNNSPFVKYINSYL